ncbi:MAG: hypothetical protein F4047_06740 [Caldilineaceae bacterium SB0670_bin_27]|uniref:Uncharacterized protein n=1 Tax=Caldilineaceae bacterium SB0664_bin_27 TaxID=2605260 RepID=A0A6B0YWU3_9CHLR|nr:hypothetical protein [Caldilineaceae bacterium SB0664_bin_27]MYJ77839.1 hypothetical protein [Caldilineaceae bacterium SB0670_bin_27]
MLINEVRSFIIGCVRIRLSQIVIVIDRKIVDPAGERPNNREGASPSLLSIDTVRTAVYLISLTGFAYCIS